MKRTDLPVFGVITTSVPRRQLAKNRRTTSFLPGETWQHLEACAQEEGLQLCLFRPEDVEFARRRVHGYVAQRRGEREIVWQRCYVPLPAVVYDNVYVHQSRRPILLRVRRLFQKRRIPLFNPPLGDKWDLASWLQRYPELWKHHPETMPYGELSDVISFLQRYRAVYVKPVWGSSGAGILEISEQDGNYRVRAAKWGKPAKPFEHTMSRRELDSFLQKASRRQKRLLQAGCDLLHIDEGKVDLRMHLQRDGEGNWQCVGLVVKQGAPASIVSNYHAGGSTYDYDWLKRWAKEHKFKKLPKEKDLLDLSQRIAVAYADKAPGLASLGLDLGIDQEGQVWLLDVNARPGRNILSQELKRMCHQLNAAFAAYLLKGKKA